MLPALEEDDLSPGLREPVGEHRSGGPAPDDRHVGRDPVGVDLVRGVDVERRQLPDLLHRLREALALRERHVARGRRAAGVGVVADDRQLLRGGEQRLDEPAELPGQPALDDVRDEAALDEGQARLGGHEGERGPQPEERIDREHREDELRLPLLVGAEGVEVVVDPLGDLFRGEHLVRADDQHLGHRHRRVVLMRPEVAEAVPPLDRGAVEQGEHHRHRGRRRCPEQQLQGGAEAGAEWGAEGVRDAVVIAEREHGQQGDDDQDMAEDHQLGRPAVPPHVAGGDEAEDREETVLGERVGDERELGGGEQAEHRIEQGLGDEEDGEEAERELQSPLGRRQLRSLHWSDCRAPRQAPRCGRSTRGRGCTSRSRSRRPG